MLQDCRAGSIGTLLFVVPAGMLVWGTQNELDLIRMILVYITVCISTVGLLISAVGDNIDITYAYWLVLGLGFAICKGSDEHEQQNV